MKRILNWLLHIANPSLETRFSDIEERLDALEHNLARQRKIAKYAILYGAGVALMGFGAGSGATHTSMHPVFAVVTFAVGFFIFLLALFLRSRS